MKRFFLLALAAIVVSGCSQDPRLESSVGKATPFTQPTTQVGEYTLSRLASLKLFEDSNICMLAMMYGDDMQEFAGTGNTHFVRDTHGCIHLDTVLMGQHVTTYVVCTADNTSTYGAETWYIAYPYITDMPDGPWCISQLPFDILEMKDIDGDGTTEIVSYADKYRQECSVYSFFKGVLTQVQ